MKHGNRMTALIVLSALAMGVFRIVWAAPWYSQWTTAGTGIAVSPAADAERDTCVEVNIRKNGPVFWLKEALTLKKNQLYKISVDIKPSQALLDAAVPVYLETEYFEGYGVGGSVEFETKPVMGMVNSADLSAGWNTLTAYYRYNGVQDSGKTRISVGINGGFLPAGQTDISYRMDNFRIEAWEEDRFRVRNMSGAWIFNDSYDTGVKDMDGFVRFSAPKACQKAYQPILFEPDTAYTAMLRVRTDRDVTGSLYIDNRGFGDTNRTDVVSDLQFRANQWTEVYGVFRYPGPEADGGGNIYLQFDGDIAQYDVADFQVFSGAPTVLNPDFSRGLQFWTVGNGRAEVVQDAAGGRCVEIMPSGQSFYQLSQTVRLEKDRWYVLYARVKINANLSAVQPTVKFHMLGYITTEGLGATHVTPGEWSEVYTCFQYTGEEKDATFILRAGQNSSGATEYDSVKNGMRVAYAGILEADGTKLIVNGDFENQYLALGTSAYTTVNQFHNDGLVNVDPFWSVQPNNLNGTVKTNLERNTLGNESQFIRMATQTNKYIGLTQTPRVQAGKTYLVSAEARAYNPNGGNLSSQFFMFDRQGYMESPVGQVSGKMWSKAAYMFTARDETARPELRFGQHEGLPCLADGVCIDNFEMAQVDSFYAQVEGINAEGARQAGYTDKIGTRQTFANGENIERKLRCITAQYQGTQLMGAEQREISIPAGGVVLESTQTACLDGAEYARVFILDAQFNPIWKRTDLERKGEQ